VEGVDIRLGSSAAVSPVVLEQLLSAFLTQLKTWLDTHTHPVGGAAPPSSGPPAVSSPGAGSLGATRVKAV
jgi:hypothetical protein